MRISIIGAGPAGAMAAVRLARAGASVCLFDPTHPREKPCGGGLTSRALGIVSDIVDISTLPGVVVDAAIVESPSQGRDVRAGTAPARVPLIDRGAAPDSSLLVVSRAVFDRALVDAAVDAGARLIAERVTDVCRRGSAMVARTDRGDHESDFVLGADGANSIVRKKLVAPFTRAQLSVAAGYFVHGATDSTIAIKSAREHPGYLWSFPRPDHLAVGVCAPAMHKVTSTQLRTQSLDWIEQHGLRAKAMLEPYAWPIPSLRGEDALRLTCSGPGWMLLGDAAGLVDPLTREGIFYALVSGQWAAEALSDASITRAAALYGDRLRGDIQPELARAARLCSLFFDPRFAALLVEALKASAAVRQVFVDLVAGVQPYHGLRRRLLGTGEWRLAAQAIRLAVLPSFTGTIRPVVSSQAT